MKTLVTRNPICIGCETRVRTENIERQTCDPCDSKGVRAPITRTEQEPASPWNSCERGHLYACTGYTKRGACFECALFRARLLPTVRYFVLHGFREAKQGRRLREIVDGSGVPRSVLGGYLYAGARAPEERVERIAEALGVTTDELKGIG